MKNSKSATSIGKYSVPTIQEGLSKIYRYCAYQERSHKEVKNKLFLYGLYSNQVDEILAQLIIEGYLNEERFAKAFAGGKFRIMKWGRIKIQHQLEMEGLTPRCIARGMAAIDNADYVKTMKALIKKKSLQTIEGNLYKKKNKVARFAISKGFEPELVWETVNDLVV